VEEGSFFLSNVFKDYFSGHARQYQNARPDYPPELFHQLAKLAPANSRAWDCATGNGQAAYTLARHFTHVFASDASFEQVRRVSRHNRISYHVAKAEASAFADDLFDLVVVAQALHWFDIDSFMAEARRVLKSNGLMAVWCYQRMYITPAIDDIILSYYTQTVGSFWPAERRHVENGYRFFDLPLEEQNLPPFEIGVDWDLQQVGDYVRSWSATQRFMREHGWDPVIALTDSLRQVWGNATQKRLARWPLAVRAGRLI